MRSMNIQIKFVGEGMHRAEVSALLVHSQTRRQGIGRMLMAALEAHACAHDRATLVLDTRVGDPSEALYQSLGWQKTGAVPDYARNANGRLHATAFYHKLIVQTWLAHSASAAPGVPTGKANEFGRSI